MSVNMSSFLCQLLYTVMPCSAVLQTLDMKINPHRFAEPPWGVTLLKSSLSRRTFPKNFVFLESNVC